MGLPVTVVVAELAMQKIEKEIFDRSPVNLLFWKRYIDDCSPLSQELRLMNFIIISTALMKRFSSLTK